MAARWVRSIGIGVVVLGLGTAARVDGATISLAGEVGAGCGSESRHTTDVRAGASLTQACDLTFTGSAGDFHDLDDVARARGVFDESGLSLGIYAQMLYTTTSNELYDYVGVKADFADRITVVGGASGTPGFLRATFAIDGSYTLSLTPGLTGSSRFSGQFFAGTSRHVLAGPATISVDLPYVFGVESDFTTGLSFTFSVLERGAFGQTKTINALADFYNTARLTDVQVLDANHQQLSNGGVISAAGLTYPLDTRTAPEPGILTLLVPAALLIRRRAGFRLPTER